MTLRDKVWHGVLMQVAKNGKFKITDLPFSESKRSTVRRVLRVMESQGWLRRDSPHASTWRIGDKAQLLLNVSDATIKKSHEGERDSVDVDDVNTEPKITPRDAVWDAVLEQLVKTGRFDIYDLPFDEGELNTVRRVLHEMDSMNWLAREGDYSSVWRLGEIAELYLNVSQQKIQQAHSVIESDSNKNTTGVLTEPEQTTLAQ